MTTALILHSRAAWRDIVRRWIKGKPSGYVFRSSDFYRWVELASFLTPADTKAHQRLGRPMWRVNLSRALSDLHKLGEIIHPGFSNLAWMVP